MAGGVEDLIGMLYEMIQDAWSVPLGADKCVVERDKVLDLLDEINNQLPNDLKQAKTIVESRSEVITNAKREAEAIRRQAEERAKQMISQEEVLLAAKQKANEMIAAAESKSREIKRVTNEYVEDSLRRTDEAISEALNEIRQTRSRFKNASAGSGRQGQSSTIIEDI